MLSIACTSTGIVRSSARILQAAAGVASSSLATSSPAWRMPRAARGSSVPTLRYSSPSAGNPRPPAGSPREGSFGWLAAWFHAPRMRHPLASPSPHAPPFCAVGSAAVRHASRAVILVRRGEHHAFTLQPLVQPHFPHLPSLILHRAPSSPHAAPSGMHDAATIHPGAPPVFHEAARTNAPATLRRHGRLRAFHCPRVRSYLA